MRVPRPHNRAISFRLCAVLSIPLAAASWLACGDEEGVKLGPNFVCHERPDDPTGYLQPICLFIADHFEWYRVDPNTLRITKVTNGNEYIGSRGEQFHTVDYDFVELSCCYMGDVAVIEVATKTVVEFYLSPK